MTTSALAKSFRVPQGHQGPQEAKGQRESQAHLVHLELMGIREPKGIEVMMGCLEWQGRRESEA